MISFHSFCRLRAHPALSLASQALDKNILGLHSIPGQNSVSEGVLIAMSAQRASQNTHVLHELTSTTIFFSEADPSEKKSMTSDVMCIYFEFDLKMFMNLL